MSDRKNEKGRARRAMLILTGYPLSLFLVGLLVNLFVFDVGPAAIALPCVWCIRALAASAILLVVNHTWIMTATELTRARFKMVSTPEDRTGDPEAAPTEGIDELRRSHNIPSWKGSNSISRDVEPT